MDVVEEEELKMALKRGPILAKTMHESWESGGVWFWHCLKSVNAMSSLMEDHICPKFSRLSLKTEEILSRYRCRESARLLIKRC